VSGDTGANQIAERVSQALAPVVTVGGADFRVSACVGTTVTVDATRDPDALIAEAQTALRRAKQHGPGRHELFAEEMRAQQRERVEGEAALRRALERGEFRVMYQPKVSLAIERMVGVEALLRWEHPERGTIPPLQFIPLAESTGLIVPIGAWVFEQVCRDTLRWTEMSRAGTEFMVSVNVSGRQFESGLVGLFKEIVARTGVDPDAICLEVTESTVMGDPEMAITTLREMKGLGMAISIDDFGTGYSSLAYLRRFPLDEVKVDKSFVDGLGRDSEATAIVAAVMGMAHALGLSVVAEGVETEQQLIALRALGCDVAQGYYYARPQPASDIDALLGTRLGERSKGAGAAIDKNAGSGTVIVVDDAADVRQLARFSLASAGFDVMEAESGEMALALARRVTPDCVVLDVNMPGMSGLDVCRALRSDPNMSGLTIVMLTADTQASEKVEAFTLDADDYIIKPFAPRDLINRVAAAMRRRREPPAAGPMNAAPGAEQLELP
jgi:EAL domain-containing protein (putative c-di-GMP-specific phosphodiesterase class I)/ActR/RegA family two-component response regulator